MWNCPSLQVYKPLYFSIVLNPIPYPQSIPLVILTGPGIGPVALECKECLTLCPERNGHLELGPIINEGDPVLEPRVGLNRERTMQVRVNQATNASSGVTSRGKWIGVHLASKTRLTDRIWSRLGLKSHASD